MKIRVSVPEVWDNVELLAAPEWTAKRVKEEALTATTGSTSDAVDAVNYATLMRQRGVNIRLTSNSWGGGGFSQALEDAIVAGGNEGMLFIAAAGNDGLDNDDDTHVFDVVDAVGPGAYAGLAFEGC